MRLGLSVEGTVGAEIVRRAGPSTQDIVQVARQLFYRGLGLDRPIRPDDVLNALDDIVRNEDPLIRTLSNEISAQQQDVLRVLALGADQIFFVGGA